MQEIYRFDRDLEVATEIFQGNARSPPNLLGSSWLSKRRKMRPFLGPAASMDLAILGVTNGGRRKCIAVCDPYRTFSPSDDIDFHRVF